MLKHGAKEKPNTFKPKTYEFKFVPPKNTEAFTFIKKRKMVTSQRISLNTLDAIHLVQIQDILYCKCDNSSTTFFLTNHEPIVVSRSIKEVEKQLGEANFFRSHQSYLVNINHIKEINKSQNYSILLSDDSKIPTATRKRKEIMQILLKK